MKLFKIELTDVGYDDYSGAVVAANTLSEVKDLCEYGNDIYDSDTHTYIIGTRFKCKDSFNRKEYQKYHIKEIGTTNKYEEPTIIMSSFCAGWKVSIK